MNFRAEFLDNKLVDIADPTKKQHIFSRTHRSAVAFSPHSRESQLGKNRPKGGRVIFRFLYEYPVLDRAGAFQQCLTNRGGVGQTRRPSVTFYGRGASTFSEAPHHG